MPVFTLPDGSTRSFDAPVPPEEVVAAIGAGLARAAVAVKIDGAFVPWGEPLAADGRLEVVTPKHPQALDVLRHSAAHLMAAAVRRRWPDVKLGFGPAREDGFHYDFVLEHRLSEADFAALEAEVAKLIKEDAPFVREAVPAARALEWARREGQPFKVEALEKLGGADEDIRAIAESMDDPVSSPAGGVLRQAQDERGAGAPAGGSARPETPPTPTPTLPPKGGGEVSSAPSPPAPSPPPPPVISLYHCGDFTDLCRGPHVRRAGQVAAFRLTQVSGSFWLGREDREAMQRLRGTAFFSPKEMDEHFALIEEAKKRDHRRLGKEQDLFHFDERAPGFPFFHPRGTVLYKALLDYSSWLHRRRGYEEIITPLILDVELWKASGHYEHYRENMFFTRGHELDMAVKPMNCPGCILTYNRRPHSYRELPLRYSELGRVHRMERSGVRHGLFRVQNFIQDDAHIFCAQGQIEDEVVGVLNLVEEIYGRFGFTEVQYELSTVPPGKSIVSAEVARSTEAQLAGALARKGLAYRLNPGEGAFYGPKIDVHVTDALRRRWQCGTIQLDASMPLRLGAVYVDAADQRQVPVMIHRAIYGSIERFLGILIEHTGGDFPFWLAPEQVRVLPLADRHLPYARAVAEEARALDLRAELDARNEKVGYKVREAELVKVPVLLIIGDQELAAQTVAVRRRGAGDQGARPRAEVLAELARAADWRRTPVTGGQ